MKYCYSRNIQIINGLSQKIKIKDELREKQQTKV